MINHKRRSNEKEYEWGTVATIEARSSSKVVLLDFDVARPVPSLVRILASLRVIGLRARWTSYYRTKRGWHMEIGIDRALIPSELVACQAVLGSDIARERMNLRRAISLRVHNVKPFWRKRWNILFRQKLT